MNRMQYVFWIWAMIGSPILAWCQNEQTPKMAVYTTMGNAKPIIRSIATNKTTTILIQSGKYRTIERSKEFLEKITEEQKYQQSGNVTDNQITKLGIQFGAEVICVVDVQVAETDLYASVAVRMIDVEKGTSSIAGMSSGAYNKVGDIEPLVENAVNDMTKSDNRTITPPANVSIPVLNSSTMLEADTYFQKAEEYFKQLNYTMAIKYYQMSIDIDPNNANVYNRMGVSYELKGNMIDKINCYKKAARLGHKGCQNWLSSNGYNW